MSKTNSADSHMYQLVMLILSIYAIGALTLRAAIGLDPTVLEVLDYADFAVCILFFGDFLLSLWRAPNKTRYLMTWGWIDLLSSIPSIDMARWGRIARIIRVLRVLRGLRAAKVLTDVILRRRAENTFLAAGLIALLLVVFSSVAILQFETTPAANIKTAEDAVWWAVTTITTVGYGDRYPVTSEGRFVAGILMSAGVGLFGILSGFLAAWFITPAQKTESELEKIQRELVEIRKEIGQLRQDLSDHDTKPESFTKATSEA